VVIDLGTILDPSERIRVLVCVNMDFAIGTSVARNAESRIDNFFFTLFAWDTKRRRTTLVFQLVFVGGEGASHATE
jgi:hypothetical protein